MGTPAAADEISIAIIPVPRPTAIRLRVGRGEKLGVEVWLLLEVYQDGSTELHTFMGPDGCIIYASHHWVHLAQSVREQCAEIQVARAEARKRPATPRRRHRQ